MGGSETTPWPVILCALFVLSLVGVWAVFSPSQIQRLALRYYERHPFQAKANLFLGWMHQPSYRWTLRGCGVGCLVLAGYLFMRVVEAWIK